MFNNKLHTVLFSLIDDISHYGINAYGAVKETSRYDRFKNTKIKTITINQLAHDSSLGVK